MNNTSKTRLSKVHPLLADQITLLEKALRTQGITFEVVQGLRTFAEQDALYAQGRTKPGKKVTNARGGQSNHNFGLAVDVCPFKGGKLDWNAIKEFDAIGAKAKEFGLEWGGDWKKLVDKPHLQLRGPSVKECLQLFKDGGLPKVWEKVSLINRTPAPSKPDVTLIAETPEGTVEVPSVAENPEKITTSDAVNVVTGQSTTVRSVLSRAALKIGAIVGSIWASGLHGKVFLIVLTVIVVALVAYEVNKFFPRIKPFLIALIKR